MENEVRNDSNVELPTTLPESSQPVANNFATNVAQEPATKNNFFNDLLNKLKSFGVGPIIAIVAVVIILVGGVTYKITSSTPKAVFKSTIKNISKGFNKTVDEYEDFTEMFDLKKNALVLGGDIKIDADLKEMKDANIDLSKLKFGGEIGIDINKKEFQTNVSIKGSSEEVNANIFVTDGKGYLTSNLFDEVVNLGSDFDIDFSELEEAFSELDEVIDIDTADYEYLNKAITNALIKSLDSKSMEKANDEIKVAGDRIKVTKYSYKFDDKAVQDMVKVIAEELSNDKDFIKKFAKIADVDKDDVEDTLKEMKKSAKDIKFDGKVVLNLYTKGIFNTFAGVSVKIDKEEYFTFYVNNDNIEMKIDNNSSSEYSKSVFELTAKSKNKKTEVEVKYNDEKVFEAEIRELSEKAIDFDYTIYDEESEYKGTIYLTQKKEKKKYSGEYKLKLEYDGESVEVSGSYSIESKESLDSVDTSKAVDPDEIDEEKIEEKIENIAKDEAFKDIVESTSEIMEEKTLNLNYDGLAVVNDIDKVKSVLSKTKGTVLYVGSSYYSQYTDLDSSTLYYNLLEAQEELDFHSYFYEDYKVNDEFKALVKDGENVAVCKTTTPTDSTPDTTTPETQTPDATVPTEQPATPTCKEYPVVYLIKDGKIVKALRGAHTKEEIKEALKEIGIE